MNKVIVSPQAGGQWIARTTIDGQELSDWGDCKDEAVDNLCRRCGWDEHKVTIEISA